MPKMTYSQKCVQTRRMHGHLSTCKKKKGHSGSHQYTKLDRDD